jgi:hypothetical protein
MDMAHTIYTLWASRIVDVYIPQPGSYEWMVDSRLGFISFQKLNRSMTVVQFLSSISYNHTALFPTFILENLFGENH